MEMLPLFLGSTPLEGVVGLPFDHEETASPPSFQDWTTPREKRNVLATRPATLDERFHMVGIFARRSSSFPKLTIQALWIGGSPNLVTPVTLKETWTFVPLKAMPILLGPNRAYLWGTPTETERNALISPAELEAFLLLSPIADW